MSSASILSFVPLFRLPESRLTSLLAGLEPEVQAVPGEYSPRPGNEENAEDVSVRPRNDYGRPE